MNNNDTQKKQALSRLFYNLMVHNYNSSATVKIPFIGGHLELEMSFNNGMIDLHSAKTFILGEVRTCRHYSFGYTCNVGMTRSTSAALNKLNEEGKSAEFEMFHEVKPVNSVNV